MRLSRSQQHVLGLISLVLLGGGLLIWWLAGQPAPPPPVANIGPVSRSAPFVRSMQDTLPDGNLQTTTLAGAADEAE